VAVNKLISSRLNPERGFCIWYGGAVGERKRWGIWAGGHASCMAGRGLINVFGVSEKPQIVTWKYGTNQNLTAIHFHVCLVN
jgi:hypothetical protein